MKKLLLLTNTVCLCFLLASCQNSQQSKSENVSDLKDTIKGSPIATDTTKVSNQTSISGTVGTDQGTKKDTTKKPINTHAIIHKAPEQEKIDSIKSAKTKNKNKK